MFVTRLLIRPSPMSARWISTLRAATTTSMTSLRSRSPITVMGHNDMTLLPSKGFSSSSKSSSETNKDLNVKSSPRSLLDYDNCKDYLLYRLDGEKEFSADEWRDLLEEITHTMPAFNSLEISPEDFDGPRGKKIVKARNKAKLGQQPLRPGNRTTFVFNLCYEQGWTWSAVSLAEYSMASGEITLMELTRVLAIVADSKDISYQGDLNQRVLKLCEAAEEKLAAMDDSSFERSNSIGWLCAALAKTSRWKEVHDTLNRESNSGKGCHGAMVCLARRAAEEGDADRMFAAMEDSNFHKDLASIKEEPPKAIDELTINWLECCANMEDRRSAVRGLDRLFSYLGDIRYFLRPAVEDWLLQESKRPGGLFEVKLTSIDKRGYCQDSQARLPPVNLEEEDYARLKEAVNSSLLVRSDIFHTTTPTEMKDFYSSLEREDYDVVVDGLNVALGNQMGIHNNKQRQDRLLEMVQRLLDLGRTPLVIGRSHMTKYRRFQFLQQLCNVILLNNASQDDPYILSAMFNSRNKNTMLVSNDGLRDHIAKIKEHSPEMLRLFMDWLTSVQVRHNLIYNERERLWYAYLTWPPSYKLQCSKAAGLWHLPLANQKEDEMDTVFMVPPKNWLTLTYK